MATSTNKRSWFWRADWFGGILNAMAVFFLHGLTNFFGTLERRYYKICQHQAPRATHPTVSPSSPPMTKALRKLGVGPRRATYRPSWLASRLQSKPKPLSIRHCFLSRRRTAASLYLQRCKVKHLPLKKLSLGILSALSSKLKHKHHPFKSKDDLRNMYCHGHWPGTG